LNSNSGAIASALSHPPEGIPLLLLPGLLSSDRCCRRSVWSHRYSWSCSRHRPVAHLQLGPAGHPFWSLLFCSFVSQWSNCEEYISYTNRKVARDPGKLV